MQLWNLIMFGNGLEKGWLDFGRDWLELGPTLLNTHIHTYLLLAGIDILKLYQFQCGIREVCTVLSAIYFVLIHFDLKY